MNKQNSKAFTIGVIISTYNNPEWLDKTLYGYTCQMRKADEIIIADDGSREDTRRLIERYKALLPITHVWHEDRGFQKCLILNQAIAASTADYLIFTDQDCVPRNDFILTHERMAQKGYFLSGGVVLINKELSEKISKEDIHSGRAFSIEWLCGQGMKRSWKMTKLLKSGFLTKLLNHATTTKATWNGGNSSTWRELVTKVNGFDERMRYGGEDREFGERLFNMGIRSKQLRYSLPLLHLYHTRPYRNEQDLLENKVIREETRKTHCTKTLHGIKQS